MRGRLIFPFEVELCRFNVQETAAAPGFDSTWREPKLVSTSDGLGSSGRKEYDPIRVPGQFAQGSDFMLLQMAANGNLAKTRFQILFHFRDLEDLELIDQSTGTALIRVGDRLSAVYNIDDYSLIQSFPNPPGVFITEARPQFGMGGTRNLLVCSFQSRDQGQR